MVVPTHSQDTPPQTVTERSPLLQQDSPSDHDHPKSRIDDDSSATVYREIRILTQYFGPAFVSNFLEYSLIMVPIVSLGHLSTTALAAGTLASMTANVSGLVIAQSFASALDTMLPPAWTSGDPTLVGLWTQRMCIVMVLLNLPMLIVWLNAESILLFLRQEPEVSRLAGLYLRGLSIGLPAYCLNQVLRRFFQCQGLFSVPTKITLLVAPINVGLTLLLIWGPEPVQLGFLGAPLAAGISFNLIFVLSIFYLCWMMPSRRSFRSLSIDSFRGLGILVYLGLAGVAQTASEWVAWEVMTIAASILGKASLAAHSILVVSSMTTFQAASALAMGASVRVGNLLGEGAARHAQIVSLVSLVVGGAVSLVWCIMFISFRHHWAYLFSQDPEVVAIVAAIMPLVGFLQFLDGIAALSSGILRACGRQGIAAIIVFFSYYVVGIPAALALAFKAHMDLLGLWLGVSLGYAFTTFFQLVVIALFNWDTEADKAQKRLQETPQVLDGQSLTNYLYECSSILETSHC
ncbi:mate-domain-containing protein [Auriculariales sp. MPI-PUGE-AT-0066]|nr:mate-domain-containing protein [Auriculariales sp. MPI-PUGE-AT-0066]